ncbi:MAG: hypothetical protein ACFFDT_08185 [Candidatus Hodarchaeota archaeon]
MGTYLPSLINTEKAIITKYINKINDRKTPIIAIGGFSGTGKDTIASYVQQFYKEKRGINLEIIGAGFLVRQTAKDLGYNEKNLEKFTKSVLTDQKFAQEVDLEIEKQTLKTALLEGGIFLGRMTPFVVGDWGLTIWLEVSAQIIAKRITIDKTRPEFGLNEEIIEEKVRLRDLTDGERLEQTYQISFRDSIAQFDFVLRNEGLSKEELRKKIFYLLENNKKTRF